MNARASRLSTRQAAFIGVGSMVGAGIFSLLGAAGKVAGAAVWISFLIAGAIALLQGYSFARLGARYPSAGGIMAYVGRIFGAEGHLTAVVAWLLYAANAVVTAMVAVSFGSYASALFAGGSTAALKAFALAVIAAMTVLNVVGSGAVARVQTIVVVVVVIGILTVFAVTTLATADRSLLAPSGYPGVTEIVASVALTFFAFLGFRVITFTAKDLAPLMGGTAGRRAPWALLLTAAAAAVLAAFFDLSAIASIGSAVALTVFALVSGGHLRIRRETGARAGMLAAAVTTTVVVLVTFAVTTLVDEPATVAALAAILGLSVLLDVAWRRRRPTGPPAVTTAA